MKRVFLPLIIFGLLSIFSLQTFSQTTIWSEDFTYADGTTVGPGSPAKWTLAIPPSPDWFEVRSNRMEGKEVDSEAVWTSESINISGYVNVTITVDLSEAGSMENSDYIQTTYQVDGGSETDFATNGYLTNDFTSATASQSGLAGTYLVLRVRMNNNSNSEYHRFDNVVVQGTIISSPPVAEFSADNTNPFIGDAVNFTDLSSNYPDSWNWSFSPPSVTYLSGTDQNSQNPQVQFDASGLYTVTLSATNSIGEDSEVKVDYIDVLPPDIIISNGSITACEGTFYDSGGSGSNYSNGENYTYTIYASGSGYQVQAAFSSFVVQNLFNGNLTDYLEIYDGENTSATLIGQYYGSNSPGTVNSTNSAGALTFYFHSNNWNNQAGWEATISCIPPVAPVADFTADLTSAGVNQTVSFTDLSTNIPTAWNWSISPATVTYTGGTNSSSQNPQVQFTATGLYTVTLTASNSGGADDEIKTDYIEVIDCTVSTLPWNEDFNTGGVIPSCWQNIDNMGNGEVWEFDNPGLRSIGTSSAANGFAIFDSDNYTNNGMAEDADLITPLFDFSAESTVYIQFEHYFLSGFGGAAEFSLSTNGGGSWTTIDNWTATTANAQIETYDVSAYVAGQSQVYFRWTWTGDWSWFWAIDDIVITNAAIATGSWTGIVDSDWDNTGNWSDGLVPGIATSVVIPAGAPNYPVIDGFATCKSLSIEDGGAITVDATGDLNVLGFMENGQGASGSFTLNGGNCNLSGDYYSEIGSLTDINSGTWTFYNWYRNSSTVWSKGTIQLSGGTINANGSIIWSNFDIVGIMDGPVEINIGGTYRNSSDDWTMTDGTINMLGTDGTGPFYIMASTWGAGNYASAYNLSINGPDDAEFRTNPEGDVTGLIVSNDLNVNTGLFTTESAGSQSDDVSVGGDFNIGVRGKATAYVTSSFTVSGNTLFEADHNNAGSFLDNGNTSVSGSSSVEQYIESEMWHLVSPPVDGATINTFLSVYLKEYNEPTDTWTYLIEPLTTPMIANQGYAAWASDALTGPKTVTYTGALNTGDFNLSSFSYTPASPKVGWNLVGNPYPSMLVWNNSWSKTDMFEWACVHQDGNDGCFNAATSEVWPTEGSPLTNGNIPVGQGFWVRASTGSASLTIPQAERVHDNQTIYKSTQTIIHQAVRLKVEGNNDKDYVWIDFTPEATEGLDPKFDLQKRWGYAESPQIYAYGQDGDLYSVSTLPMVKNGLVVPLGLQVGAEGAYSISTSEFRGMTDYGVTVILEDLATGTFTELDDETTYEFIASPEDDAHRFNLHFQDMMTGFEPNELASLSIYSWKDYVYVLTEKSIIRQVVIYDILGHEVYSEENINQSQTRIQLSTEPGYYVVKAQFDDLIITQKVFVE
ncbi:MAG: PKD domain-containing protein [Bacteroidales bacterium]